MEGTRLAEWTVCEGFGLAVAEVTPVRSAWKVVTPDGVFCLRTLNQEGLAKLAFLRDITDYLWERGFARVPRFFPTPSGEVTFAAGGETLSLISWQPGAECHLSRPGNLEAAARGLAELHLASRGFVPRPAHAPAVRLGTWETEFAGGAAFLAGAWARAWTAPRPNEVDRWLVANHGWLSGRIEEARRRLAELMAAQGAGAGAPEGVFCHNSLYYQNILIEADGTTHFIDLDRALWDHRSRDVAHFLDRYLHRAGWEPAGANRLLSAYQAVWPLTPHDLGLTWVRLLFPERFLKRLRTHYGPKRREPRHVVARLESLAEDGTERAAFLAAFPKLAGDLLTPSPARDSLPSERGVGGG
ncbi:MAG: hypothetical protein ACM3RP_11175 [Chitinophagales bacterium]